MKKAKKTKAKKVKVTYGSKIIDLILYAEKLESVQYLYEYFIHLKNNRNCFVVEMRRLVSNDLQSKGFTIADIALILSKTHATLSYLNDIRPSDFVAAEVLVNYQSWIDDEVYPKSVRKRENSHLHKNGYKTVIVYELNKLNE